MRRLSVIGLVLVLVACGGPGGTSSDTTSPETTPTTGGMTSTSVVNSGQSATTNPGSTDTTTPSGSTDTTSGSGSTDTTSAGSTGSTSAGSPGTTATPSSGIPKPDPTNPYQVASYVLDSMTTYEEKLPYTVGFENLRQAVADWRAFGLQYGPAGTRMLTERVEDGEMFDHVLMKASFQYDGHPPSASFTVAADQVGNEYKILGGHFCGLVKTQGIACVP